MTASTVSRPRTVAMTWVRKNLFRGPRDTLITLVFGPLALFLAYRVVRFVFVTGRWEIIQVNLKLLLLGRWPVESMTRLAVGDRLPGGLGRRHRRDDRRAPDPDGDLEDRRHGPGAAGR